MPRTRGPQRKWWPLSEEEAVPTFAEAKAKLRALNQGSDQLWKVAPAPGDYRTVHRLCCGLHVKCQFWVQAKFDLTTGMFGFQSSGKHSTDVVKRVRKNGILTPQQTVDVRVALRAGVAPAHMRAAMTLLEEEELQSKGLDPNDHKRKEGGLKGDERGWGSSGSWGMCSAREE